MADSNNNYDSTVGGDGVGEQGRATRHSIWWNCGSKLAAGNLSTEDVNSVNLFRIPLF